MSAPDLSLPALIAFLREQARELRADATAEVRRASELNAEADRYAAIADRLATHAALVQALRHAERFCPCGARPESPHTHPHVPGCLIESALATCDPPVADPEAVQP